MSNTETTIIQAAARSSKLSRAQVIELQGICPELNIECRYLDTVGDRDKKTSLRTLDKTDFFTRDIDELVLAGEVRIGIHSAKDLPEPLPKGLRLVALTKGIDPSDSLVIRDENKVKLVATSSERREEMVAQLYPRARFIDLRGTIEERLALLERGEVDGVVIAEAALIRLGLTHLKRIRLPGETTALQGKLAIIGRTDDHMLNTLFSSLPLIETVTHTCSNHRNGG